MTLGSPLRRALTGLSVAAAFGLPLVSLALLGGACKGKPDADLASHADGASELPAAHPDDPLGLVLRVVGSPDASPARIVVRADQDLFPDELVEGRAVEGTTLSFEPAVDGIVTIADRRELVFAPTQGFRPGTAYVGRLESLATLDQTHSPPAADAWRVEFSTPPLALVRLGAHQRDRLAGTAEVDLVFSAAVVPDQVARRLELTADGQRLRPRAVEGGSSDNVVRVRLQDEALKGEEVTVQAELEAGVPWAWDEGLTAPAGQGQVALTDGKPVEILAVTVKEGTSGHYLEVVCNDRSVETTRWYYDRDTWDGWDVSTRCMLDAEDLARTVHLGGKPVSIAQAPAGFRLFGELERGPVELRIDAGARTVDGGVLATAWEGTLEVPARKPRLSFRTKGRYLPKDAWRSLPLEHVNVPQARLTVRHVPPQNLAFWLSGDEALSSRTSDVVLQETVTLGGADDAAETTWLDVGALLPGAGRGVYELSIEGIDDAGQARDASRLLLTDMHLVAKRSGTEPGRPYPREVWGWALGVHDNAPLSGVELRLLRPSGHTLATCRTDSSGGCLLTVPEPGVDETAPMAIVAQKGDDLTYLKFDELQVRPEADVTGLPYRDSVAYRAAVWTDRGVYRPGDVAHVAAVLRQRSYVAPDEAVPVVVKVEDPQRREVRRQVLDTNAAGAIALDVPFADFATTGSWRVALEVAEREVGAATFNVEEFVPERLAVTATVPDGAKAGGWLLSDEVPVQTEARWLFGGSAAGHRVEVECELVSRPFSPEGGAGGGQARWSYGPAFLEEGAPPPVDLGRIEEHLDDEGKGSFRCPAPSRGAAVLGPAELVARVSVFEGDSGRSTKATARGPVHPAAYYLGLSTSLDKADEGDAFKVQGKVVDWQGKTQASAVSQVQLRLYRLEEEYGWVWDERTDDTEYRRLLRRVLEEERAVPVQGGAFQADLVATGDGAGWLVEVKAGDARTERYVEGDGRDWYWDPWDSYVDQTPRPQKPTFLPVTAPALAQVGETVEVTTRAPYAGRMLLTVETDRVQHQEWRQVQAGDVSWKVPLDVDDGEGGTFAPNVYVTALLLKDPHLESAQAFVPDRAFGATSVKVQPAAFSHQVKLSAPTEVRPWAPLKVSLDVGAVDEPTWATVAVVDQGILSLTGFQTPDPRDQVFARRALGVDSFETIGWTLLTEPGGASSRTGGDASGGMGGRVQMVKPVALWSGLVAVPTSGKLDLDFDIPGYRGELRVMAVVAGSRKLGAAEARVTVRDPIVLQATLPRFLVAGDLARIPVRLTNTSGQPQQVTVAVELTDLDTGLPAPAGRSPALELVSPPGGAVKLADGASETVLFTVAARRAPAAAKMVVTATAGKLVSREELELPIGRAEPEVRVVTQVPLAAGDTSLAAALDGWVEGTDQSSVWVTGSPYASALTHLGYLVRYPYGCIEQTTSSTRPLLYVRSLVEQVDPGLVAQGTVDEMVAHGIERVLSMQTPSGGFAYWPGGSSPTLWGTAYGTHMLLDARQAGFEVPDGALTSAVRWLEQQVGGRLSADGETAYAHYVVARAGKGRPAQALRVLEDLQARDKSRSQGWERLQAQEQEYLLMAALHLSGDHRYEAQLKRLDAADFQVVRGNDWSFWSALRGRGLVLSVFQDLFGADPAGQQSADRLAAVLSRQRSHWYTTQELAWAITALGKRIQAGDAALSGAQLLVDGKAVTGKGNGAWALHLASAADKVQVRLPSLKGQAWAVVTTRGVRSTEPVPMGGQGLSLERTYVDADGAPLDPARLPLGTPIYVRVDLDNDTGRYQENIALVDRLPAGWEIENSRLSGAELPQWASELDLWSADHMNLRDDRVEVFGSLPPGGERTVVYAVRAVTSGTFVLPPVQAEAMYDPDLWARRAGGSVQVVGPWDDGLL